MIKVQEYRGHIRNWEALCEELCIDKSLSRREREEMCIRDSGGRIGNLWEFQRTDQWKNGHLYLPPDEQLQVLWHNCCSGRRNCCRERKSSNIDGKEREIFCALRGTGTVLCEEESGRRGLRNFIKKELCSYPILVIIGIKIKISQSLKQREICERKSNVRKESDCEVSISKNQEEYKMKVTNDIIYVGVNDHQVRCV